MKNTKVVAAIALVLAIALGAAYFAGKKNADVIPEPTAQEKKDAAEQVKKFYGDKVIPMKKM